MVKGSSIEQAFGTLKENYSPVNVIKYIDFLKSKPVEEILENSQFIFVEPTRGAEFLLSVFESHDFTEEQLNIQHQRLQPYTTKAVQEGYENTDHLNILNKCRDILHEQHTLKSTNEYLKQDTIRILQEQMSEVDVVLENIGSMSPDVVYAEEDTVTVRALRKKYQLDFAINFVDTFMDESEDISMESFNRMMRAGFAYDNLEEEIVTEGIKQAVKRAAIAGDQASRKAANKIRKSASDTRRVKHIAKKIPGHFDTLINNTLGQIGKMDREERRKRILEGGMRFKLLKIIRNAILLSAAWMIGPATAAVAVIAHVALDRKLDNNARARLLDDLEQELKMVREKIKDAEQKGDNKKKYQLMRIENALERDVKRIQLYQKGPKISGNEVK